jgi:hypothetical protein
METILVGDCIKELNKHLKLKDKLIFEQTCTTINNYIKDDNINYWLKIMCLLRKKKGSSNCEDMMFYKYYRAKFYNVFDLLRSEGYFQESPYEEYEEIINVSYYEEDTGYDEQREILSDIYVRWTKYNKPELLNIKKAYEEYRKSITREHCLYDSTRINRETELPNPYDKIKEELKIEAREKEEVAKAKELKRREKAERNIREIEENFEAYDAYREERESYFITEDNYNYTLDMQYCDQNIFNFLVELGTISKQMCFIKENMKFL